jgi:hypothetical protein
VGNLIEGYSRGGGRGLYVEEEAFFSTILKVFKILEGDIMFMLGIKGFIKRATQKLNATSHRIAQLFILIILPNLNSIFYLKRKCPTWVNLSEGYSSGGGEVGGLSI